MAANGRLKLVSAMPLPITFISLSSADRKQGHLWWDDPDMAGSILSTRKKKKHWYIRQTWLWKVSTRSQHGIASFLGCGDRRSGLLLISPERNRRHDSSLKGLAYLIN